MAQPVDGHCRAAFRAGSCKCAAPQYLAPDPHRRDIRAHRRDEGRAGRGERARRVRFAARVLGWPFAWLGYKGDPSLPPVTRAITALGPAYVKFGQILSTRPDVVGVELANQLTMLQDRLPPSRPRSPARRSRPRWASRCRCCSAIFRTRRRRLDRAGPRARRADNRREVAVKVLRPGIEGAFRRDIDAFHFAANMIERLSPPPAACVPRDINHFRSVVTGELDLRLGGRLGLGSRKTPPTTPAAVPVPKPHWHLSARRVS